MIDPTGETVYSYDNADRLVSIVNPKAENYSFAFDAGNRLSSITRPGSTTEFAFDDTNFLTSIIHKQGVVEIGKFEYWRDEIGNRTQIRTPAGDKLFGYDDNNQLTNATNPEAPVNFQNEAYSYDSIANRLTDQQGGYAYDEKSQRLVEDYRYFYYFDNNGNMISRQEKADFPNGEVTNYIYSSENQLKSFKVVENGVLKKEVTYLYDALGRRVAKNVRDLTAESDPIKTFNRRYVYDGQEILLEYNGNNQLLARYTHSGLRTDDVLAADVTSDGVSAGLAQNSGSYQYLKDAQGTVTDVADSSGNKLQQYVYSAFGELLGIKDAYGADVSAAPPVRTSYSYTGREYDSESGMLYYRARYYLPEIGRFLQQDGNAGELNVPITLVRYVYAQNSPLNYGDPLGEFTLSLGGLLGLGAGVGGVLGFGVAFAHDDSKPFLKGWEWGFFTTFGGGSCAGASGGLSGFISISANDHLSQLSGQSVSVGATGGFLGKLGIDISIPIASGASPSLTGSFGVGGGASYNQYVTHTQFTGGPKNNVPQQKQTK